MTDEGSAHLDEAIAQTRAFDAASMLHQDLLQSAQQKALPHESVVPDSDDERHPETEEALSLEYMKLLLLGSSVEYFVVAGRRKQLSVNDRRVLKAIDEKDEPISVRTYDWLLAASPLHL